MSRIAIVGSGYVGLTTAACLADLGHQVTGIDIDPQRLRLLRRHRLPFFEPGLQEILQRNATSGRLTFTDSYPLGLEGAEFIFIAVGTPQDDRGDADLTYVRQAAASIAEHMRTPAVIINKSTVPIGTGDIVSEIVHERIGAGVAFAVVSNPEFLREGSAVQDFLNPDRVVLGAHDAGSAAQVAELYKSLNAPVLITNLYTAEMIKYASNAFLATRISFINEISRICEKLDADVSVVAQGMGMDSRIGPDFLDAGLGYGGSCFPKDVMALARTSENIGSHPQLLHAVMDINRDQRRRLVEKLHDMVGSLRGQTIGVLGLSFKPNTDDMREAPSIDIIQALLKRGALVRAYDPAAMPVARAQLPGITYCRDAYSVARGSDGLVIVTEWNEFRHLDLARVKKLMRRPIVVDGRNIYDPEEMKAAGFVYKGVGR